MPLEQLIWIIIVAIVFFVLLGFALWTGGYFQNVIPGLKNLIR